MTKDMGTAPLLAATATAGLATGVRSTLGPAAARLSAGPSPFARAALATGVAGELVADKLPKVPSRLKPIPLAGRAASGAVTGSLIARSQHRSVVTPALIGAAAAVAGSYAGVRWRARWADAGRRDLGGALIEDAVGVGLAYAAYRALRRRRNA